MSTHVSVSSSWKAITFCTRFCSSETSAELAEDRFTVPPALDDLTEEPSERLELLFLSVESMLRRAAAAAAALMFPVPAAPRLGCTAPVVDRCRNDVDVSVVADATGSGNAFAKKMLLWRFQ